MYISRNEPNIGIEQVAVPDRVAKILTYPERVFEHNINRLRQVVINGTEIHPGANYVQSQTGFKRWEYSLTSYNLCSQVDSSLTHPRVLLQVSEVWRS